MNPLLNLIERLKKEGRNLAVLIIDEEDFRDSRTKDQDPPEYVRTKYQRQVILKCSKLGIPSLFVYMDAPINEALHKAAPEGLRKDFWKTNTNALSSKQLFKELQTNQISDVIVMGCATDVCVKSTIFGAGELPPQEKQMFIDNAHQFEQAGLNINDVIKAAEGGLLGLGINVITAHELVTNDLDSRMLGKKISWPKAEGLTIIENPKYGRFFATEKTPPSHEEDTFPVYKK